MKLRSCACIVALVGLGGCASMHDQAAMTPVQPSSAQPTIDIDYAYVAAVNRKSLMQQVDVRWVNPPVKRTPPSTTH